jgi:hypothetical protein
MYMHFKEKHMGMKPLTTRFDRPLMEKMAKELAEGTDLTVSEIHRAAMNIGLTELASNKEVFSDGLNETVKAWQEPEL